MDLSYNKIPWFSVAFSGKCTLREFRNHTTPRVYYTSLIPHRILHHCRKLNAKFQQTILGKMTNLKYLDLSHNNFKGFKDEQFGRNYQLKRIKMDHNYLKSLPDRVFGECRNLGKNWVFIVDLWSISYGITSQGSKIPQHWHNFYVKKAHITSLFSFYRR